MSLYLTETDRRRLVTAREAMVSPLAHQAGGPAWRMRGYLEMFDSVHQALAVFEPDGAVLFRSHALERIFDVDPRWSRIAAAMEDLARKMAPRGAEPMDGSEPRARTKQAEVSTPRCGYRLWASPVRPSVFGTDGVLVQVERRGGVLPPREDIEARFGLTPREAEVALLLAEGLHNRRIAERLSISPHTARRHTEAVLKRLRIGSRAAVAVTLLR